MLGAALTSSLETVTCRLSGPIVIPARGTKVRWRPIRPSLTVVPSSVTIHPGESITWTNSDAVDHQVSSTKASLSSPVMHTGQTYSFMFATSGTFAVTDLLNKD